MHRPSLSPVITDTSADTSAPVVHLTRRARIEAERSASAAATKDVDARIEAVPGHGARPSFDEIVTPAGPATPPAPASPIDLAPSSPAMPASTAAPVTPPAPSSPVVASSTARSAARAVPSSTTKPVIPSSTTTATGPRRVLGQVPASRATERSATRARTSVTHVDRASRHIVSRPASRTAAPARGAAFQRAASRVTAVGALFFVAGLVVSTSLPAQALYTPETDPTSARQTSTGATQSLAVGAGTAEAETNRDQYSVSSATQYKNVDASSFTNDPNGTIQWPFLTGVPITSGFGGRQVEGCSFCSTNHMGVDFAPGEGTPIRTIAAGTVIKVQAGDGGFGNDVWVQHDVDGKQFVSVYGHMKENSFKVVKGQQVAVGDELGEVGSTGNSTGPHLHLEVHVDGVPVDPLAWLKANAN